MSCVIIGDSIAKIIHKAMPACIEHVQGGIGSSSFEKHFSFYITSDLTIISLGANDHHGGTLVALRSIRSKIAGKVVWLMPNIHRKTTMDAIRNVASQYRDRIVYTSLYVGPRLHPTSQQATVISKLFSDRD